MERYATAKTRVIGGKQYRRTYHFATKAKAERYAAQERKEGNSVRIIPHAGVYTVYIRKG